MIDGKIFQLCNSTTEEEALKLDSKRYKAQYKRDGERILAVITKGEAILINRTGKICNHHFQEIVDELKTFEDCIIDGEIISQDGDFLKLQSRAMTQNIHKIKELTKTIPLFYKVFDILKVGEAEIMDKPLRERDTELTALFQRRTGKLNAGLLKFVKQEDTGEIAEVLAKVKAEKGEGIVVKSLDAIYEHRRSDGWLKLKLVKEADIVVNKFEDNNAGIKVFSKDGNIELQCSGEQHKELKSLLQSKGEATITIQYLSKNPITQKLRFPSYKKLVVE